VNILKAIQPSDKANVSHHTEKGQHKLHRHRKGFDLSLVRVRAFNRNIRASKHDGEEDR
jgi:hypothetical protein